MRTRKDFIPKSIRICDIFMKITKKIKEFLDCVINNHKGLDSEINGIGVLEFVYFV